MILLIASSRRTRNSESLQSCIKIQPAVPCFKSHIAGNFRMMQNFTVFADWAGIAKIRTAKLKRSHGWCGLDREKTRILNHENLTDDRQICEILHQWKFPAIRYILQVYYDEAWRKNSTKPMYSRNIIHPREYENTPKHCVCGRENIPNVWFMASYYKSAVLWFSKVYGLYHLCGIVNFLGLHSWNTIIPRSGYDTHTP